MTRREGLIVGLPLEGLRIMMLGDSLRSEPHTQGMGPNTFFPHAAGRVQEQLNVRIPSYDLIPLVIQYITASLSNKWTSPHPTTLYRSTHLVLRTSTANARKKKSLSYNHSRSIRQRGRNVKSWQLLKQKTKEAAGQLETTNNQGTRQSKDNASY